MDTDKIERGIRRMEWNRDNARSCFDGTKSPGFKEDAEFFDFVIGLAKAAVAKNETTDEDMQKKEMAKKYPKHVMDIISDLKAQAEECVRKRSRILAQIEAAEWLADKFIVDR